MFKNTLSNVLSLVHDKPPGASVKLVYWDTSTLRRVTPLGRSRQIIQGWRWTPYLRILSRNVQMILKIKVNDPNFQYQHHQHIFFKSLSVTRQSKAQKIVAHSITIINLLIKPAQEAFYPDKLNSNSDAKTFPGSRIFVADGDQTKVVVVATLSGVSGTLFPQVRSRSRDHSWRPAFSAC